MGDWQCRIGFVENRPNCRESRFGSSPKPNIEIRARVFGPNGKVSLLPSFTKTAVADVRDYTDDLRIRFHVCSGSHADVRAEGAASSEISLHEGFVDDDDAPP